MAFYEEISKYYDYIFPTGEEQVSFLCQAAGLPPKSVLDIACGTGGYSIELSELGYNVTASDIDDEMINELNNKISENGYRISVKKSNMLDVDKNVCGKFDLAFCIGNSVVHLANKQEVIKFFKAAKRLIKRHGSFVVQIINFNRIINKGITELPKIVNKETGLVFERYYRYDSVENKIYFKTILSVEDKKLENEIELLPLLHDEIIDLLAAANFKQVCSYGDFKGGEFDENNSFVLILEAKKDGPFL